ncbi:protein kinase [Aeromonas caviae]|uniref:protein kinase n=1 Tax=Aeromonas caviae TaxID=648 RepID=UPI003977AD6C
MPLIDPAFATLAGPPSLDSCTRDVYGADLNFTPAQVMAMVQGVAAAARHLHERGILHGDLYAHNLLYSLQPAMPHSPQEAPGRVLLGDFGAASCYDRADEVLAGRLERLEVRAFGCLLAELLARCDGRDADLDPLHRLARECGFEVPSRRPTFAQILTRLAAMATSLPGVVA